MIVVMNVRMFMHVRKNMHTHAQIQLFFVEDKRSHYHFTLGLRRHERYTFRQSVGGSLLKHLLGLVLEGEVNSA